MEAAKWELVEWDIKEREREGEGGREQQGCRCVGGVPKGNPSGWQTKLGLMAGNENKIEIVLTSAAVQCEFQFAGKTAVLRFREGHVNKHFFC